MSNELPITAIISEAVQLGIDISDFVPQVPETERYRTCVILGSFKAHDQIIQVSQEFGSLGIRVLAPEIAPISGEINGFQLLASDEAFRGELEARYGPISDALFAVSVEERFMGTIAQAGFIYVVAPKGYGGITVSQELGVARGFRKPIYVSEPLDPEVENTQGWYSITHMVKAYTPGQVARMVLANNLDVSTYEWCDGYVFTWPPDRRRDFRDNAPSV